MTTGYMPDCEKESLKMDRRTDILKRKIQRGGLNVMWTVVHIAPNRPEAELVKNMLEGEGLLVMLRPIGVPHMGDSANVEVMVPETEAEEACAILDASDRLI